MPTCLFCNDQTNFKFSARDYERSDDVSEYSVFWCDKCQFGRLDAEFTPSRVASFYPKEYYTHADGDSACKLSETLLDKILFHLAWRMDKSRPVTSDIFPVRNSVCDIGCGNGGHLRLFVGDSYKIVGIDPDPGARAAASDAGTIFAGTAEELPAEISDDRFDVVLLSHVLEHCISPRAAVHSAKSILAEGGTLMIEVPNNEAYCFSELRGIWPWTDIPRHLSFFTKKSLQSLVEAEGLKVRSTEYCGFTRQFTPSWWTKQSTIWDRIGEGRKPNFELAAWLNLIRYAIAPESKSHDSIRLFACH
jgi:SAM-dependent methyltransferase